MKLSSLHKRLVDMSYPEQIALIEGIRYRRSIERPAAKKRAATTTKRTSKAKVNKTKSLLESLSPSEKAAMIASLKEDL